MDSERAANNRCSDRNFLFKKVTSIISSRAFPSELYHDSRVFLKRATVPLFPYIQSIKGKNIIPKVDRLQNKL